MKLEITPYHSELIHRLEQIVTEADNGYEMYACDLTRILLADCKKEIAEVEQPLENIHDQAEKLRALVKEKFQVVS